MKHTFRSLAFAAALVPAIAAAQVPNYPQTLPANSVVGRLGVGPGPSQAIPFAALVSSLQQSGSLLKGPTTTAIGHLVLWNNLTGTLLSDGGALGTGVLASLNATLNATGGLVGFNGNLGTPTAGVLTNATGLPISTGVSGLGTGCAAFLATPTSANLRACLTDEVGTGAAYFVGGALGTPASGTGTNLTGIPLSGLTGYGTGIQTALGTNTGTVGAPAILIAAGTLTLNTTAISSGACGTVQTATATGVASTDAISASFSADPTSTTGYAPTTNGMLTIVMYPTTNTINAKVCNNTSSSITPGASVGINYRVVR